MTKNTSAISLLSKQEQEHLEAIFRLALTNTDKQLVMKEDGTAYVQTGDIPAEWLRDSSAQMRPYLFFAKNDKAAADKLKAVIERQALYMAIDPYANAFRDDFTIWERKFELDSLSYPILLAWTYWKVTGDASIFTPAVKKAFDCAVETMIAEQHHDDATSTYVHHELKKNPVAYTGMIWSAFRPSDDACTYHYLIPSQMQAVQALTALEEMEKFMGRADRAARARKVSTEVQAGIEKYGTVNHSKYGRIYAYEVDGRGNANLMDDANLPSLLSIPYFGYKGEDDEVYKATRRFVLSKDNPYFYAGRYEGQELSGVGSPHTPLAPALPNLKSVFSKKGNPFKISPRKALGASFMQLKRVFTKACHPFKKTGMVWPLAQLAQGLTTKDRNEQAKVLRMLIASDPGDNRLHESYLADNPKIYTRPDFGWPNALLAEFMLMTVKGHQPLPVPVSPAAPQGNNPAADKKEPPKNGF